jgi:Transglutaminase-like superfamily
MLRMRAELRRVRLAVEIVVAYLRARHELRRAPIETVVRRLRSRGSGSPEPDPNGLREAQRLGHAVSKALSVMPGDTRCLRRSLVLVQLLARRGISAELVIGTRTDPVFLAHAWVEHEGQPVLPPGDGSFGRLVAL